MMMKTFEPYLIESWPPMLKNFLEQLEPASYIQDTEISDANRERYLEITSNHLVIGRHATRLLNSEIDSISSHGLRFHSLELVAWKLQKAVEAGHLTSNLAWELLCGSKPIADPGEKRANLLFFVTDDAELSNCEWSLIYQFEEWGGEAIAFTETGKLYRSILKKIGKACVVEVGIRPNLITKQYELDNIIRQSLASLRGELQPAGFSIESDSEDRLQVIRVYER